MGLWALALSTRKGTFSLCVWKSGRKCYYRNMEEPRLFLRTRITSCSGMQIFWANTLTEVCLFLSFPSSSYKRRKMVVLSYTCSFLCSIVNNYDHVLLNNKMT